MTQCNQSLDLWRLAFSYYLIEPRIERRFNRLGHAPASARGAPKAVMTAS